MTSHAKAIAISTEVSLLLVEAANYTDWHVDLEDLRRSVVFSVVKSDGSTQGEASPMPVPDSLVPVYDVLVEALLSHREAGDTHSFALDLGPLRFRGEKIREGRYALRRSHKKVETWERLKLGSTAPAILMDPEFRDGGIILIAGEHGAGKSTTARTTVVERLKEYGGYALAVEAPIEVEMEGFHGKGYLEQVDASSTGYKHEVETAMRKFPAAMRSMFYFGEVLEEKAAAELVRLGPRGNLVVTTLHAKNEFAAVEMLITLAERGGETRARELLGSSLRAVIHQRLEGNVPKVVAIKADDAIRNTIASPDTPLSNLVERFDSAKRAAMSNSSGFRAAMRPMPR